MFWHVLEAINLYILTSLNDMHEAQKILQWLNSHGISATLEGQHTYNLRKYIPDGLGIYVLDANQFQDAKRLLREFDARLSKSAFKKLTIIEKLKVKKLDKLVVGLGTVLLIVFVIWLTSNLIV